MKNNKIFVANSPYSKNNIIISLFISSNAIIYLLVISIWNKQSKKLIRHKFSNTFTIF